MKKITFIVSVLALVMAQGCNTKVEKQEKVETNQNEESIFPKGERGSATNFTGNAHNYNLVENDSIYNTLAGNVYFEKSARSNWHSHPSGQILIILDGEGYHQLEGQPKQLMKKGDVIKCPPNTRHWHGATESSSLTQMYILPKTENGVVTWLEPVTEETYSAK
ncbi:cupin domain-containing protein [Leeuwenhoekiella sp. NPDC079379]|uniref:cupin domain-containing protein n=1 Tax=Leeuwenhoekiella sp. NPDC079379 TaxID=3364122 RepID=UPI0037C55A76